MRRSEFCFVYLIALVAAPSLLLKTALIASSEMDIGETFSEVALPAPKDADQSDDLVVRRSVISATACIPFISSTGPAGRSILPRCT